MQQVLWLMMLTSGCSQRDTKVIVMDADGSQSKEVARALRKFGINVRSHMHRYFLCFWLNTGIEDKVFYSDCFIYQLSINFKQLCPHAHSSLLGLWFQHLVWCQCGNLAHYVFKRFFLLVIWAYYRDDIELMVDSKPGLQPVYGQNLRAQTPPLRFWRRLEILTKSQYLHFELSLRCRGAAFLLWFCHIICKTYPFLVNIITLASCFWWRSQYKHKAGLLQDVVQLVLMVILVLEWFSLCCPYFSNFAYNF